MSSRVHASSYSHDIFCSYFDKESSGVIETILAVFSAYKCNIFNPKRDLAGAAVNSEAMQNHVRGSKVLLLLLSPLCFSSKWIRAEVMAALEAGVPIVPVYF